MNFIRKFVVCVLLFGPAWVGAENIQMQRTPSGNTYASGSEVNLLQPIAGDLLAAGGKLRIEREVKADATLAGGSIEVRAPIGQDLRLAGGTITIAAKVGGELVAASGNIEIQEAARITGPAWIAGGNVSFRGSAGQGIRIYARSLLLAGQINGDAHIFAQQISFDPEARITGNLRYTSPTPLAPEIADRIAGTIDYEPMPAEDRAPVVVSVGWVGFLVMLMLAFLVIAMLTYLLFPVAVRVSQTAYSGSPGKSLLLGVALLFSLPPVAILAFITVIGIPTGLVLLAVYPVLLLAGYLGALFFIASKFSAVLHRPLESAWWEQLVLLALAILTLCLAAWIPFVGGLILAIAVATGIGAWVLSIYRRFWANKK